VVIIDKDIDQLVDQRCINASLKLIDIASSQIRKNPGNLLANGSLLVRKGNA
jgi:hypothetical protein